MDFFRRIPHPKLLAGTVTLLALGFIIGYSQGKTNETNLVKNSFMPINESGTSYTFVHPLLAYRTPEATELDEYVSLKSSMQNIIDSAVNGGSAARVAVYFRDLEAGRWVGINPDDTYHPASLMKVPILISYYKGAEDNPSIFSERITYDPSIVPKDPLIAPTELIAGRSYSVEDLIKSMIDNSDNGATYTLESRINPDFLDATYIALGIHPEDNASVYQISARTYGIFFRVLYNATFLSSEYSEKALKLLSQATFTDGLVAGVPKGTVVAHKFGNYALNQNGTVTGIELSDCGIVYYSAHPYLLCVMTSSRDVPTASKVIADISRAAYAAVAQQYAPK